MYSSFGSTTQYKVLMKNGYCFGGTPSSEIITIKLWYPICHSSQALFPAQCNHWALIPLILSGSLNSFLTCVYYQYSAECLRETFCCVPEFPSCTALCPANSNLLGLSRSSDLSFQFRKSAGFHLVPLPAQYLRNYLKALSGAVVGLTCLFPVSGITPFLHEVHCLENNFSCILSSFSCFRRDRVLHNSQCVWSLTGAHSNDFISP